MWKRHDTCDYYIPTGATQVPKAKIAAFDMDSTLIFSNKGEKYAISKSGWCFAYANIPEKMKELHDAGYIITIFSNRRGAPSSIKAAKDRILEMATHITVPFSVFFATKADKYRKPSIGMYELFVSIFGIKELEAAFYCGDAAGSTAKYEDNRWSDSDIGIAKAIGFQFIEPQDYFASFPRPIIKPETQVVITIGQIGSGWEVNRPYIGKAVDLNEKQSLVIIDDTYFSGAYPLPTLSEGKTPVYYVLGTHPTAAVRQQICDLLQVKNVEYYVYQKATQTADAGYIKSLQLPVVYVRCS